MGEWMTKNWEVNESANIKINKEYNLLRDISKIEHNFWRILIEDIKIGSKIKDLLIYKLAKLILKGINIKVISFLSKVMFYFEILHCMFIWATYIILGLLLSFLNYIFLNIYFLNLRGQELDEYLI